MKSLRLMHFKSINDSENIEFKPLTIFLGKNGCGKSSFLRFIPLLKQSFETSKKEPFLWFGNYVDLGEFKFVIPQVATKEYFEFSISLDINSTRFNRPRFITYYRHYAELTSSQDSEKVVFTIKARVKKDLISNVDIYFFDQHISISYLKDYKVKNISVNDVLFNCPKDSFMSYDGNKANQLIPGLTYNDSESIESVFYRNRVPKIIYASLKELFPNLSKSNFDKIVEFIFKDFSLKSQKTFFKYLTKKTNSSLVRENFKNLTEECESFININTIYNVFMLPYIINLINNYLNQELRMTRYIKPLRANAERYYRNSGIGINEVNSDGSNLPLVLYNLSLKKRKEFLDWCLENLGVGFYVESKFGHISLEVAKENNEKVNIADTGYGYSQILPILLQLWMIIDESNDLISFSEFVENRYFIIEQPELHLHPAFQSLLGDLFAKVINDFKKRNKNLFIILETHSDFLVNRVGSLVSDNTLSKSDVNIVLVEKKDNVSRFKQTSFNEHGVIIDWPVGFMSPDF